MSNIVSHKKKFVIPAIASAIIPGLGQLFKGQIFKGVAVWAAVGITAFLFKSWLFPIFGIVWLINVLDALLSNDNEKLL
ncbi:MAG: hypothetical protein H6581_02855 [Bacteroidia bacterium]|nr:hypothetical protein [Bacteroidia bacterium]